MFGLAPWLTQRYHNLAQRYFEENKQLSVRRSAVSASLSVIATAGYYAAYVIILREAAIAQITIGTLTLLAGSFRGSRDLIQRLLLAASDIYSQSLNLRDLFAFFEIRPTISTRAGATAVPQPIREGFVFENVGFQYPGSDRWAVRNVSFAIRPGERVALVGENGAGKTTLTKLIARLYDPTEGRVLLDGRDLREYDLASVRQAIGVIFQDFVRYDMRFDENIGVGEIGLTRGYLEALNADKADVVKSRSRTGADHRRRRALARDLAARSLAARIPPECLGGALRTASISPAASGRRSRWLAPTCERRNCSFSMSRPRRSTRGPSTRSSCDSRSSWRGRMAVIISHRFSTVRMADRIVVLESGRVVEEGTHAALASNGGVYAELFEMQAAGYR